MAESDAADMIFGHWINVDMSGTFTHRHVRRAIESIRLPAFVAIYRSRTIHETWFMSSHGLYSRGLMDDPAWGRICTDHRSGQRIMRAIDAILIGQGHHLCRNEDETQKAMLLV